jgi:hypothetical protein
MCCLSYVATQEHAVGMEHSVHERGEKLVYNFNQKSQKDCVTLETEDENTKYRIK